MRKKIKLLFLSLMICSLGTIAMAKEVHPTMQDYDWWKKARFGIFIHWGPSSILGLGGGSWQRRDCPQGLAASTNSTTPGVLPKGIKDNSYLNEYAAYLAPIPQDIYDNLYQIFNPTQFDAKEVVAMIKDSGAKYVVFTTKHHDGFCMFDSKYTDYDIMNTPYKKDILKELTDECHKAGIKVIFYYSKPDWYDVRHDPANPKPYEEYMANQIKELCTNYGEVKGFWWDGGNKVKVDGKLISDIILTNQPGAIYNSRGGMNLPGVCFATPEQKLGSFNRGWPWESCVTMQGEGWFWNGGKNHMSLNSCIQLLINSIIGDGNLALDFGLNGAGLPAEKVRENFLGIGKWLKKYGESVYETKGGPYKPGTWGGATCKGNDVYLHITQEWPDGVMTLPALPAKIKNISVLTGGNATVTESNGIFTIKLAPEFHKIPDTIIKLTLDKNAEDINPIESEKAIFVSLNADANSSSHAPNWCTLAGSVTLKDFEVNMPETKYFGEDDGPAGKPEANSNFKPSKELLKKYPWIKTRRDHIWRFWKCDSKDKKPWLEIDFGKPKSFNKVTILEKYNRIKRYQLQYLKDGQWIPFHDGFELGSLALQLKDDIVAQKVRLKIYLWESDQPEEGAGIREFDFWHTK